MKNYINTWDIEHKYGMDMEIPVSEYSKNDIRMKEFIEKLSEVIANSDSGWNHVEMVIMVNSKEKYARKFMVLCTKKYRERWIPIDGNSMACNFSVLGENLW